MSLEAEQSIVGSIMIEAKLIPQCIELLKPDDFLDSTCRMIYASCIDMYIKGESPDVITVMAKLTKDNGWSRESISEYKIHITRMVEIVPKISNIASYAGIVRNDAMRHRASENLADVTAALNSSADIEECRNIASKLLDSLNGKVEKTSVDATQGMCRYLQSQFEKREYIKTGIRKIDEHARLRKGHMIVVGGRPSAGKTAFTLQIAMEMAKTLNVVYFTLETGEDEVYERMIACYTNTDFGKVQDRNQDVFDRIIGCSDNFSRLKIHVIDAAGWEIEKINATASQLQADVVFIDYLQLIPGKGKDEYQRVSNSSLAIKTMTRTTGRLVFALSQLNRSNATSPPTMQDLRSSGQIEQDADTIIFVHNPDQQEQIGERKVIIAKNKSGKTGNIDMWFDGSKQRFTAMEDCR